ncbi:hypothetical protein ETU10_08395 [Apibacter muscae]|uniref:hypothetical protein n=1 Tax=Apibacter muscae TaxID=2509004 RepID=UPI0011AC5BAA|nr:hypothetical protein [Apibacter muscae]TWP23105.1 hypothetical protein ETU10_08395 [Apibacter muscae]
METTIITTQEINSSVNKLEGYREKQLKVLEQNPFIEITDNKTYEEAKKARTNLVSARTEIEKVDKGIASILNNFRKGISDTKTNLISITKPAEDLQQEEVKRWEEIKEQEKLEKARIEEERKENIKQSISQIVNKWKSEINVLVFNKIDSYKDFFNSEIENTDKSKFEEFEIDFLDKVEEVKTLLNSKIQELKDKENQRLENERIRKEQEQENQRLKEERRKLQEEKEAQEIERKKIEEQERIKNEQIQKEQKQEAQRLAEEKRKIEAEKKAIEAEKRKQLEEKEKKEKEERERIEEEKKAKRLEELKPDKEKIVDFLASIKIVELPNLKDPDILKHLSSITIEINKVIDNKIIEIQDFK